MTVNGGLLIVLALVGEQLGRQGRLFYEFCLEDRVPADHLLRRIDAATSSVIWR